MTTGWQLAYFFLFCFGTFVFASMWHLWQIILVSILGFIAFVSVLRFDRPFFWECAGGMANIFATVLQLIQSLPLEERSVAEAFYILNLVPHSILLGIVYGMLLVGVKDLRWQSGCAVLNTFSIIIAVCSFPELSNDATVRFCQHIVVQWFVTGLSWWINWNLLDGFSKYVVDCLIKWSRYGLQEIFQRSD